MAKIDKSKSQTYDFLSKNKSIEDIKQQPNIFVKEIKNKRHGGKTFRIDNTNNRQVNQVNHDLSRNNREILEPVTSNLINNEKEQEINNNIWIKFKNYLNWPTSNTQVVIQVRKKYIEQLEQSNLEKDKENQQLKNEINKLKLGQSNVNLTKFSYNAITIYDEKQRKNTGIEKIHEEILPINNEIYFITTFQNINNSLTEETICFQQLTNGSIKIFKQIKQYDNIDDYKKDITLINDISTNNNYQYVPIKDFLKQQQDFKLKPTKIEMTLWCIFTAIAVLAGISTFIGVIILFFPTVAVNSIATIGLKVVGTLSSISFIRIFASLFSSATRKVDVWFGNKLYKNKEQKEKEKKERQSIIKNLSTDKLETKLQTQYEILKQEVDNKKEKNPDQLINKNIIKHNLNNISQNLNIESENQNFDSSILNTVNNQELQPSTISANTWNKVKCLLT